MVSTAPAPGMEDTQVLTGRDAARAMERTEASRELFEEQRLEAIEKGEGAPSLPVNLGIAADGVFRFRSNVRMTTIYLRQPPETGDDRKDVIAAEKWTLWAKNEFGPKWKSDTNLDLKLWGKGLRSFQFTEVPGKQECWFETTDPAIAAYIRSRIEEPDHSHIYEEVRPMLATLPDGTQIEVMPVTREGKAAVAKAQAV